MTAVLRHYISAMSDSALSPQRLPHRQAIHLYPLMLFLRLPLLVFYLNNDYVFLVYHIVNNIGLQYQMTYLHTGSES